MTVNRETAANVAAFVAAMSPENAGDALCKIMTAITKADGIEFALAFMDEVQAALERQLKEVRH